MTDFIHLIMKKDFYTNRSHECRHENEGHRLSNQNKNSSFKKKNSINVYS